MLQLRPAVLLVLLTVLLVSCTGSGGGTRQAPVDRRGDLGDLVGVDLADLDATAYHQAAGRIAAVTGVAYDPAAGKAQGPRIVLRAGDVLLVAHGAAKQWLWTALSPGGSRLWQERILLGVPVTLEDWQLQPGERLEHWLLSVDFEPAAGRRLASLTWALSARGLNLIRARDGIGRSQAQLVSVEHPELRLEPGDLEGSELEVLTAIMRLSQPDAREQRHRASTRSRLELMASGTHAWIAPAAAGVLILP